MTQAQAVTAEGVGILSFIEEFEALMNRYKSTIASGNEHADRTMAEIFENSYGRTIGHMVVCEVIRATSAITDNDGRLAHSSPNCEFVINPMTLEWMFNTNNGVTIDRIKVENDIVSDTRAAQALVALNSMNGDVDLIDYVNARVEFVAAMYETGKAKVDEVNTIIQTQLEAA